MKKALIVDDAAADRQNLNRILVDAGWVVATATNGNEALAMAQRDPPGVIFMDVNMPGLDGFSATRQLAQDAATARIPVILVTSKDQKADRMFAELVGAKGFVTKPYTQAQILQQVEGR